MQPLASVIRDLRGGDLVRAGDAGARDRLPRPDPPSGHRPRHGGSAGGHARAPRADPGGSSRRCRVGRRSSPAACLTAEANPLVAHWNCFDPSHPPAFKMISSAHGTPSLLTPFRPRRLLQAPDRPPARVSVQTASEMPLSRAMSGRRVLDIPPVLPSIICICHPRNPAESGAGTDSPRGRGAPRQRRSALCQPLGGGSRGPYRYAHQFTG